MGRGQFFKDANCILEPGVCCSQLKPAICRLEFAGSTHYSKVINCGLKHGTNLKYRPFAFTEHGAIMAATVLKSRQAVRASLFVVRAFVQLREILSTHRDLAEKLNIFERKLQDHDGKLQDHDGQILGIIDAIRDFMNEPDDPPKPPIGFHTEIAPVTPSSKNRT